VLFPGTGHLFSERYVMGAVGVILTTWSLLVMLVSFLIFNISEGLGSVLFPASLYAAAGLWVLMLVSLVLQDLHFIRGRTDRKIAYSAGYSMYLARNYDASLKMFLTLHRVFPDDIAAAVMVARNYLRMGVPGKAESILKRTRKRTEETGWLWEIDHTLEGIRSAPQADA
jgi:hypothetical protein